MRKDRILRSGARGMNLQGATDAIDSLKQYVEIGVVRAEGGDSHYSIEDGSVWVDVVIMPTETPVTCRLATGVGSPGNGVWMVPANGTEVVVLFPGGSSEAGGIVTAILPSANLPEGIAENRIVIVADEVAIYKNGIASAEPLITKSQFDVHVHPTGVGPSGVPNNTATSGTGVLKAE